jgi:cytochrome c
MDLLDQSIILPSKDYLTLLRYLLIMTSAIHFPYMGMVICATILSMAFNSRDRDIANPLFGRTAKDLMDMVVPNRMVPLVFGVLPLIAMCMIYGQWLFQSSAGMLWMLPVGAGVVAIGFGPIIAYRATLYPEGRNSSVNFMLGGAGVGALLLGTLIVIGTITRFQDPERWHLPQHLIRQLTSFNVIWRYALFLLTGMATTGCAILFFFFNWAGREPVTDKDYAKLLKNFGAGLGIGALFLIPVMLFFYLVTTPILAMSGEVFGLACVVTGVLFVIFALLYLNFVSDRPRFGGTTFMLFIVVFLLFAVGDQLTLVNATKEHTAALVTEWEEAEARRQLDREANMQAAVKIDPVRGEEVFKTICSTCHRMDEKLVGPPLNDVLSKYAGNADAMVQFISSPTKVDPEYPPMPNPGLSLADVKSVVAYLLGETPGEGSTDSGSGH